MRAFWAAVSLVNGGSGGRDMMTSRISYAAARLSSESKESMAGFLSADNESKSTVFAIITSIRHQPSSTREAI
ncbi:MAG: hypothetical protein WBF59_01700, partial [Bradyrhizobium sp.]|uniref:hypothetical protein n=1 Tax=Bradyrhizobium sp. TaxID=376 RepID=UPI003C33EBE0